MKLLGGTIGELVERTLNVGVREIFKDHLVEVGKVLREVPARLFLGARLGVFIVVLKEKLLGLLEGNRRHFRLRLCREEPFGLSSGVSKAGVRVPGKRNSFALGPPHYGPRFLPETYTDTKTGGRVVPIGFVGGGRLQSTHCRISEM